MNVSEVVGRQIKERPVIQLGSEGDQGCLNRDVKLNIGLKDDWKSTVKIKSSRMFWGKKMTNP